MAYAVWESKMTRIPFPYITKNDAAWCFLSLSLSLAFAPIPFKFHSVPPKKGVETETQCPLSTWTWTLSLSLNLSLSFSFLPNPTSVSLSLFPTLKRLHLCLYNLTDRDDGNLLLHGGEGQRGFGGVQRHTHQCQHRSQTGSGEDVARRQR
jgi:hypothetical protein